MSNSRELQEEEREVLLSIYDGDPAFKQLSPSTYQYKYGEDGDSKSFLLEISWSENYPAEKPIVNMDAFYNKHIIQSVKAHIKECILKEADDYLGAAMTFSLFESVKEKLSDLICEQPEEETAATQIQELTIQCPDDVVLKKPVVKKEHLSKAQKRKQWDRVDSKGDKPRGADWVDIIKHLSQTGPKATSADLLSTS
ncbi:RWD domain-containing protein 4 isoform X1 [Lycorma delicatula]|uniref:RWD domain-containing protein 4 isoform X1 n=1 Tax=Lycorma delicatula TaxID=130591 RepID=UPI003F513E18